jgi:hypothetical protein
MGKFKYVFLSGVVALVFFAGCSKNTQITGPVGAQGSAGVPGANVSGPSNPILLFPNNFIASKTTANLYEWYTIYGSYNPSINYDLTVYAYKPSIPGEDYKLPWVNVWEYGTPADELYSSMRGDTIQIWYYSTTPWPASNDSTIQFQYTIIPLNQ